MNLKKRVKIAESKDYTNYGILGIVAIVAVVGLIMLFMEKSQYSESVTGFASFFSKPDCFTSKERPCYNSISEDKGFVRFTVKEGEKAFQNCMKEYSGTENSEGIWYVYPTYNCLNKGYYESAHHCENPKRVAGGALVHGSYIINFTGFCMGDVGSSSTSDNGGSEAPSDDGKTSEKGPDTRVQILTPNGGETFTIGRDGYLPNLIIWTGNKPSKVALVTADATSNSDPTNSIVGWIAAYNYPYMNVVDWDAGQVYDSTFTSLKQITPGKYKILVVEANEKGRFVLWDNKANKLGNFDVSDQAFSILPHRELTVVYPNGGEIFKYGETINITFNAVRIDNNLVTVRVLKRTGGIITLGPLSADTGTYSVQWTIPSGPFTLPSESSNDYYVQVSTALLYTDVYGKPTSQIRSNIGDTSDRDFSIVAP